MMARAYASERSSVVTDLVRDRALFVTMAFVLTVFGIVMIYSTSSIEGLIFESTNHNPGYYAFRQTIYAALGAVAAFVASRFDYHVWARQLIVPIFGVTLVLLGLVLTPFAGKDAYGATRWIGLGFFHLQPSEFAKITLILVAAGLIEDYQRGYVGDRMAFAYKIIGFLLFPLALILLEPDKGTVLVIGVTIVLMMFVAGLPLKRLFQLFGGVVAFILVLGFLDGYSRRRFIVTFNPWLDETDTGYQLVQGLRALGSGGLFGMGIGMGHQKYSYLPMAYNDFIYAIVGEELGLLGTLSVLVAFFLLIYFGFRIARNAPDLLGQLVAAGCTSILGVQLLVNVCGVLCIIPLSGKPIPFLSYGGSSIMGTLLLVGMVLSVARAAQADAGEGAYAAYDDAPAYQGYGARSGGLRVIRGGRSTSPSDIRASRELTQTYGSGRITTNRNGSRRIDLGPSASDRLRRR